MVTISIGTKKLLKKCIKIEFNNNNIRVSTNFYVTVSSVKYSKILYVCIYSKNIKVRIL